LPVREQLYHPEQLDQESQHSQPHQEDGFQEQEAFQLRWLQPRFDMFKTLTFIHIDITDQLIAMGYPAEDFEQFFRNSMSDVQRFFTLRHKGHYKILNL
jgi:phosphatidylinositol-3,4,5-trisphosphate 3-phosphatase/dual-specificity protein phosphatase PTEN